MKIPRNYIELLMTLERFATYIALVIVMLLIVLSSFINIPYLDTNSPQIIIYMTAFLFLFIHTMFIYFFSKQPHYETSQTQEDNFEYYKIMLKNAEKELLTTQLYAITPQKDIVEEYLKKINSEIENKKRETFLFRRIIGINDINDINFARNNLKLINEIPFVEMDIFIIDLTENSMFDIFPNIIIKDKSEAFVAFPIKKEGKSRGIYFVDPKAAKTVFYHYWLKLKETKKAKTATEEILDHLEEKITNTDVEMP